MKDEESEPKIDESLLTKEQKEELEKEKIVPWKFIIFMGVLLLLIIACVIVICCLPKS